MSELIVDIFLPVTTLLVITIECCSVSSGTSHQMLMEQWRSMTKVLPRKYNTLFQET